MAKQAEVKRKYTTITIPTPLYESISKRIEKTGFSSVSDYATYVLRETTAELNSSKENKTKSDSEIIRKLKALGYM
jgi:Arc/MetJ-type ribon-helix-helix transcriptional regulator